MAKKRTITLPQNMIKLSLGIFFVLIGLFGILTTVEESVFSISNKYNKQITIEIIFGIIEFVCGAFIIVSMVTVFTRKVKYSVSVIIFVLWLLRIALSKFIFGIIIRDSAIVFNPNISSWLIVLSCELIIASCLWLNLKTYQD